MEDCFTGQNAVVGLQIPNFGTSVAARRLHIKFDCPVAHQNFSLLATAHDCETGVLEISFLGLLTFLHNPFLW